MERDGEMQDGIPIQEGPGLQCLSLPKSPLPSVSLSEAGSLPGTDPGDGRGRAPGLHALNFQSHDKPPLGAKRLGTAELKAGPESTVGATEAGPVQGQDGVIVTTLFQGVVHSVPTHGRSLAQPQARVHVGSWTEITGEFKEDRAQPPNEEPSMNYNLLPKG